MSVSIVNTDISNVERPDEGVVKDSSSIKVDQVFQSITASAQTPTLLGTSAPIQVVRSAIIISKKEALDLVRRDGMQLANLSEDLKRDVFVISAALNQNGLALQHVPMDLREELLAGALMQNPEAFQFASEKSRTDVRMIRMACMWNPNAVRYATPRGLALLAVHEDPMALQNLNEESRRDPEIVRMAVKKNGLALQFAAEHLRADRGIVRAATRENGLALQFAHIDCQADPEIVQGAIQNDPGARQFAHVSLQNLTEEELILRLSQADRLNRLVDYMVEVQNKNPEEARKIATEIHDFIEPKLNELQGDEPRFFFSTEHEKLPRSIHVLPRQQLTLVCFNKKRPEPGKNDGRLGSGSFKHVHEAFDYRTGRVFARSMGISEVEELCAKRLDGIPGIVKTYATYSYNSPKSGKEKRVAIQEKIIRISEDTLNRKQKTEAVKALLITAEEMHERGVIHNDLELRNILFGKDRRYMIIDFGVATILSHEQRARAKRSEFGEGVLRNLFFGIMSSGESEHLIRRIFKEQLSTAEIISELDKITNHTLG